MHNFQENLMTTLLTISSTFNPSSHFKMFLFGLASAWAPWKPLTPYKIRSVSFGLRIGSLDYPRATSRFAESVSAGAPWMSLKAPQPVLSGMGSLETPLSTSSFLPQPINQAINQSIISGYIWSSAASISSGIDFLQSQIWDCNCGCHWRPLLMIFIVFSLS